MFGGCGRGAQTAFEINGIARAQLGNPARCRRLHGAVVRAIRGQSVEHVVHQVADGAHFRGVLDLQVLDGVHVARPGVVAAPRIALDDRVDLTQHLNRRPAGERLGRDQLQLVALAHELAPHEAAHLRIDLPRSAPRNPASSSGACANGF